MSTSLSEDTSNVKDLEILFIYVKSNEKYIINYNLPVLFVYVVWILSIKDPISWIFHLVCVSVRTVQFLLFTVHVLPTLSKIYIFYLFTFWAETKIITPGCSSLPVMLVTCSSEGGLLIFTARITVSAKWNVCRRLHG